MADLAEPETGSVFRFGALETHNWSIERHKVRYLIKNARIRQRIGLSRCSLARLACVNLSISGPRVRLVCGGGT